MDKAGRAVRDPTMERLRICYFADGKSVHIRRWTTWFAARGHEVHLATLRPAPLQGVHVHSLPFSGRLGAVRFGRNIRAVRGLLRSIRPDLVHGHQLLGYGLWAAVSKVRPLVLSAWGSDVLVQPERSWLSRRLLRWMLPRADAVISAASHLAARVSFYGAIAGRSHVIPMGVDLRRWPPVTYRSGTRGQVVVSTRNLEPIYDVETLVRALPLLHETHPDLRCLVLGDGSERRKLEALAAEVGARPQVDFGGHVPEDVLFRALQQSRLYASTSLSDGASVSLLEALSQGAFPVVSDIPANREWVRDRENGYLFPVRDAQTLADRIDRALADEDLLQEASVVNNRLVAERGDIDANLRRVEDLYQSLVGLH